MNSTCNISISNKLNITILKTTKYKFLLLHSNNYYAKYRLNLETSIYFNKTCRILLLKINHGCTFGFKKIEALLSSNTYALTNYFFKKIKFSGKSYKILKNKRYFLFEFNKSHVEVVLWRNFFFKKVEKK